MGAVNWPPDVVSRSAKGGGKMEVWCSTIGQRVSRV